MDKEKSIQVESLEAILYLSDLSLIRAVEDLINALLKNNAICLHDFSPEAREKIMYRQKVRAQLAELTERQKAINNLTDLMDKGLSGYSTKQCTCHGAGDPE